MRAAISPVLREHLGDEPTGALVAFVDAVGDEWKQDVLNIAAERFERRLVEETSKLRVETAAARAAIERQMAELGAAICGDLATGRVEILKWCFFFWIGQVAAMAALLAFMLRAR